MSVFLVDGDIIAFRCAVTVPEPELKDIAISRTLIMLENIFYEEYVTEFDIYLSSDNNFRKKIDPTYKANRTKPDPIHLETCKNYLIDFWGATIIDGLEADDCLGIAQTKDSTICSIDKDLLMIPGMHYNFVKKERQYIDEISAIRNFYKQMLIGDPVDNIHGVKGIGVKRAGYLLDDISDPEEMFDIVREYYCDDARMLRTGKLLWILQEKDKIWTHKNLPEDLLIGTNHSKQQEEVSLDSLQQTEDQTNQSSEPI